LNPSGWKFPATFWIANVIELFERGAYYGTFIALSLYLTDVAGFSDVAAGWTGAGFAGLVYLLPFVVGAIADRIGFRPALAIAFASAAIGYASLGYLHSKPAVLVALLLVAIGGAFVKPIITGTVSKCSTGETRARAFSIFYMMVNIGSFTGKTIARPVRVTLGLDHVPLYSAGAAAIAFVLVLLFYRPVDDPSARPRSAMDSIRGLAAVLGNGRFLSLIFITAGFWIIQGQLYASMPKYVIRMVGPGASPEWYANVNPLVVVLFVVPITKLVERLRPVGAIGIALALIPLSALTMALSSRFEGAVDLLGFAVHPVTLMMVLGIVLQGFGECFLAPRYLEYASKQAPPGQEGLYMGYGYLNTFFAWLFGFIASGYLLEAFCPDPKTLPEADRLAHSAALAGKGAMPAAYAHAHWIWFVFAGVGATAFVCLMIFRTINREHGEGTAA
jgi:dipeptide/tripeptide permease